MAYSMRDIYPNYTPEETTKGETVPNTNDQAVLQNSDTPVADHHDKKIVFWLVAIAAVFVFLHIGR